MRRFRILPVTFGAVALAAGLLGDQRRTAAQTRKTVWDGVYAAEQASRGKAAYEANCVGCHAPDLSGATGPELAGDRFRTKWDFQTLNQLFTEMKTRMPRNNPSTLAEATYVDLTSFILEANAFPSGNEPLGPDAAALTAILIQKQRGAQPAELPTGTLAQIVGCLTPGAGGWSLSNATMAVRTDNPDASKGEQRTALEKAPLGSHLFQLLGVYGSLDADKGHKMEAKGFLIRDPNGDRMNVVTLEMIGTSCMP